MSSSAQAVQQCQERARVLLIEDNPGDVELVREGLRRSAPGFYVECVKSLALGLDRLKNKEIDVLLLDLTLPDADTVESVESVRKQHPAVPVIVLSGRSDSQTILAAVKCGARDYFVKGRVDFNLLRDAILREMHAARLHS